ncbi:unnamed protein product, partial [Leptidea sinapis]
IFRPMHAH